MEVQNKLKKLFEIAYFVAKLELPFTTYENLCGLEMKHGVDLGQTYRNDKACKNFVLTISENVKCDLTDLLTSCRFIGVMADGVTDVGTREVEDVYVRFLENGEASNKFVGLKECPNAKAPGVLQAIGEAVKGVDENWKQKTVSLGSDGASVMVGKNSGVYALLKREIPYLLSLHCVAHKLELAFQDAAKDVVLFREAKELLQGLWKYYHYSPKAVRELKELAQSVGDRAYRTVKAGGSRWVPHLERALTVLLTKNFQLIVLHFEHAVEARDSSKDMQGRAQNYLKKLKSYKFLAFLHLLLDVTKEFSHVSLLFQKNDVSVPEIQDRVNTLNAALDAMQVRPGTHLREFQQSVGEDGTFKEISLTRQPNDVVSFTNIRESLINATKQYMNNRFPNFVQDPVLKAVATVSDPLGWPRDRGQLLTHGENDVTVLIDHFNLVLVNHGFSTPDCLHEWLELKMHVLRRQERVSARPFWKEMFTDYSDRFPNLLMLAEICLVLPVQTACCERGNSCLTRIMTDWRASLNVDTREALMNISMNGCGFQEYDATPAVQRWLNSGERLKRPEFMN